MKYLKTYENHNVKSKLDILKKYVHILHKCSSVSFSEDFFIALHNFLILEQGFFEDIVKARYELNNFLDLENNNTCESIYEEFLFLYNVENQVRNNMESFDRLKVINDYIKDKPEIYKKLLDYDDTLENIELYKAANKYNL